MQTRLMIVCKVNRILFPTCKYQTAFSSAASHGHGGVEDAMTQGVETNPHHNHNDDEEKEKEKEKGMINNNNPMKMKDDMHPKTPLSISSKSKLQSPGVKTPFQQQKRTEEDDKHYFEHHKASPLSKIEILDSRKPLARVTDGTAGGYFGDEPAITWRPEQLDTAEESLLRATQMFKDAATRGVPDWPHSRRLRQLRGEDW